MMARKDARYRAPIGSISNGDQVDAGDRSRRSFLGALAALGVTTATSGIPWLERTAKNAKPVGGPPKTLRVGYFPTHMLPGTRNLETAERVWPTHFGSRNPHPVSIGISRSIWETYQVM
jgi:hypothetical protein